MMRNDSDYLEALVQNAGEPIAGCARESVSYEQPAAYSAFASASASF
jgi:hypothetical protein